MICFDDISFNSERIRMKENIKNFRFSERMNINQAVRRNMGFVLMPSMAAIDNIYVE